MGKKPPKQTNPQPNQTYCCREDCAALVTDGFVMCIYGLCPRSNHGYLFLQERSVDYGQDYFPVFWSPSAER